MKVSVEDIRRQYAELSDEGLLEVERQDLVDRARECYDEELGRRQLTRPQLAPPVPARREAPGDIEDLAVLANYDSQEEAQLARELVRAAGIQAYLSNEHTVAMIRGPQFGGLTGLELMVPASSLRSAREVLAAQVTDEALAGEALAPTNHIRHGMGAVRPYLYGKLDLLDFVQQVFGAVELERHDFSPTAAHVEAMIGDSVVVMEASDPPHAAAAPASIYVYVPDVDATYQHALDAGGVTVAQPADKPYQERSAAVKDSFGNTWWISTYQGD